MMPGRYLSTISLIAAASLLVLTGSCKREAARDEKAGPRQGWTNEQRLGWYQGTQGSRMMPWSWAG